MQTSPTNHFVEHLAEGTVLLHGQFKITRYLNSGGFGITYVAADSLERTVVVKECFPGSFCRRNGMLVQARSQEYVAELEAVVGLFLREARALAKLKHPNIVGVHQVFEFNNTAYMALDFVKGRNLLELTNSPGRSLTPRQVRSLLEKLLSAVGSIHEAGLLHRDISPDNVIVTDEYDPVLIDFGAAREQASKATQALSALRVVKDGYSPQEFYLAGSVQGPFSDLYSLAATFYHVITGDLPPDSQRRLSSHVAGEPDPYVPLRDRTSAYDPAFCAALDRAMAILPKDRVKSAEEWRRLMNETPEAKASTPLISRAQGISRSIRMPQPEPVAVSAPRPDPTRPLAPAQKAQKAQKAKKAKQAKAKAAKATRAAAAGRARRGRSRMPALMAGAAVAIAVGGAVLAAMEPPAAPLAASDELTAMAERTSARPAAPAAAAATSRPVPAAFDAKTLAVAKRAEKSFAEGRVKLRETAAVPFEVDAAGVIRKVDPARADAPPRDWQVVAVNAARVTSDAEIDAALRAAAAAGATASLTLRDGASGTLATRDVEAGIVYSTRFPGGTVTRTEAGPDGWRTRVAEAPEGGALRPGDELVSTIATGEAFEAGDALARAAAGALAEGEGALEVVIRREGSLWAAAISLAAGGT